MRIREYVQMYKINQIILSTRRSGSTSWILKSAMENPEVVIVSASRKHSHQMRLSYQNFCKTRNWFARIKWIILGSPEPIFKSLDERFEGLNLPIVFDNSTLLTENI